MRHFKPVLNSKGLLAASMAMLSGQAVAEVAGRVSFVSGDAVVSATDGNSRILKRGDAINGGDRITTRAGRVQVRFTDGGFVSLQPNTVFGVDEYLYTSRKPEETSLFFSLVQGGMRTITGAIGKVNKKSYQVRTPVATIGIRGTEYLASLGTNGLIVSVGSGFVNVANKSGNITAGAGQNIRVRSQGAKPDLGSEQADIQASGTSGDQDEEENENEQQDDSTETVSIADVQNEEGEYIFLFTTPTSLPDSVPHEGPYYTLTSPKLLNAAEGAIFFADFDQTGAVTTAPGGLVKLYDNDGIEHFYADTLKVVNSGTVGSLSWGEFTNGSTSTNGLFENCLDGCATGPFALTDSEFMPYVVGAPAPSNLSKGKAIYTLQGATPARDANGYAGRVDRFSITVNLDFSTIQADLQVTMPGTPLLGDFPQILTSDPLTYNVVTNGPIGILNLGTAAGFSLDSSMLQVTGSGGACASAGSCYAAIKGFFAGPGASQIGAAYMIGDSMNGASISGVAGLGLASYNSATPLDSGDGYTAAYALKSTASTAGGFTGFDTSASPPIYSDNSLTNTFGNDRLLQSATQFGTSLTVLDRGTSLATNQGQVGALTWGRWYATTSATATVNGSAHTLGANDSLHYVTGPMTQPNIFAGINQAYGYGATATYTYQGGTTATGSDGRTGVVTSGSTLLVAFGPNRVDINVGIDMNSGNDYRLGGSAYFGSGGSASFQAFGSGGPGCTVVGSGGCNASVSGFFAGQQAQQIGLGYSISDLGDSSQVTGAAAFGRGGFTPGTPQ